MRGRAGGDEADGRGGQAGHDADQRPAERGAPRRVLLRPSVGEERQAPVNRSSVTRPGPCSGLLPCAERGGGEEEGPVAPVVARRDGHRCGGGRPEGVAKARGIGGVLVVAMVVVVPDGVGVWARQQPAAEEEATTVRRRRRGVVGEEELSLSGGWRHVAPHLTRNKIPFVLFLLRRAAPGPCVCLLLCTGHRCCRPAGPFLLFFSYCIFLAILPVLLRALFFCFLPWKNWHGSNDHLCVYSADDDGKMFVTFIFFVVFFRTKDLYVYIGCFLFYFREKRIFSFANLRASRYPSNLQDSKDAGGRTWTNIRLHIDVSVTMLTLVSCPCPFHRFPNVCSPATAMHIMTASNLD